MLTDWLRRTFKFILEPVAGVFRKLHISPNAITVLGFLLSLLVAYLILIDQMLAAGAVYVVGSIMDAIDGTLARQMGVRSRFGAFLDSTLDRLGESVVFSALGIWFAINDNMWGLVLAFAALIFSLLVSYTRARAEALGFECKVGIGTRVERFFVMSFALLLQQPFIGLIVIVVLTFITVVQRVYVVWQQATAEVMEQTESS